MSNLMKTPSLNAALALFIFAAGFSSGFFFRTPDAQAPASATEMHRTEVARGPATTSVTSRGARRAVSEREQGVDDPSRDDDDEPRERRGRVAVLADLDLALQSDDRDAIHEALEELGDLAEPLSPEEIETLGGLLDSVSGESVELLARALVRNGGVKGFETVMAFASDPEVSLESRRMALEGIAHAPPELAELIAPTIADFMESGMPRELQHTAAHALGRMMGEQSVETLLGLLEDRPGIRPEIVFDAIAGTGRGEDTDTLLGMLSGDLDRRSRLGLLRAIGEISGREGDGSVLLDLLAGATDSRSRQIIAEAIAESSHRMDLSTLHHALELASGDDHAQTEIARAMAHQGGRAGLDALVEAMNDPNIALDQRSLAHALHEYDGPEAIPLQLELLRQSRDGEAVERLAFDIARSGDSASVGELVTMLEGGSEQQRMGIAHALRQASRDTVPLDRLLDALRTETHPEVGAELAGSIGSVYGSEGVRHVAEVLGDVPDPDRRGAMLHGLGETWERNPEQARELYVHLAGTDPAPGVRHQAIEILHDQGDPSLITPLEKLLAGESDAEVREHIQNAIRDLESEL